MKLLTLLPGHAHAGLTPLRPAGRQSWLARRLTSILLLATAATILTAQQVDLDFKQSANNETNGPVQGLGNIHWIGSILQSNNSTYYEGMSVHQRVIVLDMPATTGNVHSLEFHHESTKGGHHAYDFMTGWQQGIDYNEAVLNVTYSINECGESIGPPATMDEICAALHGGTNWIDVDIPDDPYVDPEDGTYLQRIQAYEGDWGNRTARVYANAPITAAYFCGDVRHEGDPATNSDAHYTLVVEGDPNGDAISQMIVEFACHLAVSGPNTSGINWGPGQGSSQINGGPYHVTLHDLGGDVTPAPDCQQAEIVSLGAEDNQIQGADILIPCPTCTVSGPTGPFCPNGPTQEYTVTIDGECMNQSTVTWSFVTNTSGASFVGGNTGTTVTINPGTTCGSFTLQSSFDCDNCLDPVTCEISGTVEDITDPQFTYCPPGGDLGCDPTIPAAGTATATDNCGTPTITSSLGTPESLGGCDWQVTRTYTATDACGNTAQCFQVYTYMVSSPLTIQCPDDDGVGACLSQASVDDAFALWLEGFSFTGGCNAVESGLAEATAPPACGGSTTINYSVSDDCGQSTSCSATFTVTAAPPVQETCQTDTTVNACTSQAVINAKFAAWLNGTTFTGGCNASMSTNPASPTAPPACGGFTTVTWTIESDCEDEVVCTATFTVTNAPTLSVNCPAPVTVGACTSQAAINTAYAAWLAGFSTSGGCSPTSTDLTPYGTPPSACSSTQTVITINYSASDDCNTASCSSTFTVPAQPALSVNCPAPVTVSACMTQSALNTAYANWLAGFSTSGGCSPTSTNLTPYLTPPSACSSSTIVITINYSASDDCNSASCSSTFTVPAQPGVTITCPPDKSLTCEESTDPSNTGMPTGTGCNLVYTYEDNYITETMCGSEEGGVFIRTWTATDDCGNTAQCDQTIACGPCITVCALTQGFYSSTNGTFPYNEANMTAVELIQYALTTYGPMVLGSPAPGGGGSLTVNASGAACLNSILPASSNPKEFPNDLVLGPNCTNSGQWLKNGKLKSTVWGQTITLWLNTRLFDELYALDLANACVGAPPSFVPGTVTTVGQLVDFASAALGGTPNLNPGQLGQLADYLGGINVEFDECAYACDIYYPGYEPPAVLPPVDNKLSNILMANRIRPVMAEPQVETTAPSDGTVDIQVYPNPAKDRLMVDLKGLFSAQADISIFNSLGNAVYRHTERDVRSSVHAVEVTGWTPGLYMIRVAYTTDGEASTYVSTFFITR